MKQWFMLDRNEWLVIITLYPVVPIINYLVLGEPYFANRSLFLSVTVVTSALFVSFAWLMDVWKNHVQRRYPAQAQSVQRVVLSLLMYIAISVLLIGLIFAVYEHAGVPSYRFTLANFGWVVLIGVMLNTLSAGVFEAIYFHGQWKQSLTREYELKQLHVQRQFDVLKQQVNPHFLFNSLNSLISLIGEDPAKAEAFAEELSSVYRYVLRTNRGDESYSDGVNQNLTSLDTELEFIRSYFHLLKTRHGQGLDMVVRVEERFGTYQLPPLTLQLLVENAVKHNIALPEQPLRIVIESDEQARLRVRNTLQKKKSRVLSNGLGLTNIMTKYQMLGQPTPLVQEADGEFVVTLPLIRH